MPASVLDPRTGRANAFFACAPGLELLLARELGGLGLDAVHPEPGGVSLEADLAGLARAHVGVGLALDARIHVARFEVRHFRQLEREVRRIEWSELLPPGSTLRIAAESRRSKIYHTGAVKERLRAFVAAPAQGDAAVDLRARIVDDVLTLSLGSAGAPLSNRGYRLETAKAPLREDLARALLVLAGWPGRGGDLVDPMCGAGTLLIEGAHLLTRRPPGFDRSFACESFPFFAPGLFASARARAAEHARPPERGRMISGCDRDAGAVAVAKRNAERAGVDISVERASLSAAPFFMSPAPTGLWASNPPRAARVSSGRDLRPLHQRMGEIFRRLPAGWTLALAAADPRLGRAAGASTSRVMTDHGGQKIYLLTSD